MLLFSSEPMVPSVASLDSDFIVREGQKVKQGEEESPRFWPASEEAQLSVLSTFVALFYSSLLSC